MGACPVRGSGGARFGRPLYAELLPALTPAFAFVAMAVASFTIRTRKGPLITWDFAQANMYWGLFYLFAGGIALGRILSGSGAAEAFANALVPSAGSGGFMAVFLLSLLTMVLTQVTSNTAAIAIVVPVTISTFQSLDLNPIPFVYIVTVIGNCGFIRPSSAGGPAVAAGYGVNLQTMAVKGLIASLLVLVTLVVLGYALARLVARLRSGLGDGWLLESHLPPPNRSLGETRVRLEPGRRRHHVQSTKISSHRRDPSARAACTPGGVQRSSRPGWTRIDHRRASSAADILRGVVIERSNAFGIDLLREVLEVDDRTNVVLSPLSASMALGMTLDGAAGTTLDGMRTALRFEDLSRAEINDSYRSLVNLLMELDPEWKFRSRTLCGRTRSLPFTKAFFDAVAEHFGARAESRDFADPATLTEINTWVSENTRGLIDRILEEGELDPALALLLLNAVYFDGRWSTEFDPEDTEPRPFTRADGSTVTVDMMNLEGVEFPFGSANDLVAAELPYGGGAYSMIVAVPWGRHAGQGSPGRDGRERLGCADRIARTPGA